MNRFLSFAAVVIIAALIVSLLPGPLTAAPTAQQRNKVRVADGLLKKAGNLYKAHKFKEAGEVITQLQEQLSELEAEGNAKDTAALTANLHKGLAKAHGLLELEGIKLAPLVSGGGKTTVDKATGDKPTGKPGDISFTKQVAPLLVAKCGRCHIDKSSGEFSVASYAALKKGSKDGIVFQPGSGVGSRLIDVLDNGDMPKGGGRLPDADIALLTKWIDQGAKFDGKDPAERISGAPAKEEPARPKLEVVQATGKEDVLFSRDIGPVLLANCIGCHGVQNPRGRLGMNTFARLLQGGETGIAIQPGNAAESLIIRKLRGTGGGNRMPQGKPPLPEETIAKFEKWIAGGAKFDAPDPSRPLEEVVAIMHAKLASHEELTRDRQALAEKNWRLVLPDTSPDQHETEHFLLYGNVGAATLADIGRIAEDLVPKLTKALKPPADQPLIKGRMTIYVFQKHYDYEEIGTMLERRDIPPEWRGHWRYTIVDAYGCVVPAKSDEYSLPALLAQQITAVYVASQGNVPRWFAEGSGRAIAARLEPKDARVRQWDQHMLSSAEASGKPDDFLSGKLNPDDADVLSYGFVKWLMSNIGRYQSVLASVRGGMPFDQAFQKVYGGLPNQVVGGWSPQAASKRGR